MNLNKKLINHFNEFIVDERRELFEKKIQERTKHITIVLENIYQGRNISASIRSADCFGIQDVHIIENNNLFNQDPSVSIGSEKWISLYRYNQKKQNTKDTINKLKRDGYKIIVTTPHAKAKTLYDLNISNKNALLFGSEGDGCSEIALNMADEKIKIPLYGFSESFNISVSVALCLQHLTFKLRKSNFNWKLTNQEKEKIMLQWLKKSITSSKKIEELFINNLKKK
ncbi:MAG: rRNA methyltransferase [Flavobacteriales bacterium]|nr:rRNA methyltransferase [Flavobacteriales bacterium]|tara:strand:- start:10524 stop:11204 length:681 start_codon:yes stop_codon:yes gene_type:complete